jgi:hypothetical protein
VIYGMCDGRLSYLHVCLLPRWSAHLSAASHRTSWIDQQRQTKEQRRARQKLELQALYRQFIQDASKLYSDALEHSSTEIPRLVDIYATLNRIRVLSSPKVIEEADKALRTIVDTYFAHAREFSPPSTAT